ncbi:ankyrin repeat and LEM domain-containing protein 2 [Polypterus senegalus]|uniref:ankyrin repeat and LEM domain-containing protein 2 n=1 Tax=Polypterus senegalus TaxID=55291 RepID=UPI0019630048|nr:ankyrin repeat and LEM domain-containing protein 2 [Polypterus senegalus]XP_039627401.1 ankyrin repeat and LEM domain-containing protein 2 [Polypterus senegalus]XP_039627402.1 ankyrin repeat and LEM domain-containing protein 2 [Polypterus senegalus]XP_039627403.1 ankyrin repeat and LEM domain-containing protein 2 [Polypterus senegalus]
MDAILSRLKELSPDELREEIIGAGLKCGPITATTRTIFERKLARALLENQAEKNECNKTPDTETNCSTETDGSSSKGDQSKTLSSSSVPMDSFRQRVGTSSQSEDGDFGYDVGLNPPEEDALIQMCESASSESGEIFICQTPSKGPPASPPLYYGVCPVWDDILARNDRVHVYTDKKEALQAVKTMKGSRFKAFSNRDDAEKFAKGICDYFPSPSSSSLSISPLKTGMSFSKDGTSSLDSDTVNRERANSFKSPRTQDLTAKLRKAVEKGDEATFKELIWSNPRYLIGSGDNPTVVQEGCRYNVMHVAAKENQPAICQLLLDTLENPDFMRLMYPDDSEPMLQKRICYILDLYLNTPDKVGFETPLHFACKFGRPDVVNVLCSHPYIEKHCKNKYGQEPADVICERSKNKSEELKRRIRDYLEDRCYVPLLRATDNSSPAVIGTPWSPDPQETAFSPFSPRNMGSPKDPVMAVRAFAGPLSPSKADEFRKIWKTPPRDRAGHFHHVMKSDHERGVERVGRDLAHERGLPWAEFWEFLDCFIDLASSEGLQKMEEYLSKKDTSEPIKQEMGENETSNRFKSLLGRPKKSSNSISVGAFLEETDDMSLEEIKNRQNAALTNISSVCAKDCFGATGGLECHILPVNHSADLIEAAAEHEKNQLEKEMISSNKNGFCSPVDNERIQNGERPSRNPSDSSLSPISNLMVEFERMTLEECTEHEQNLSENVNGGIKSHEIKGIGSSEVISEMSHLGFSEKEESVFAKVNLKSSSFWKNCEPMENEMEAEDKSSTSSEEWLTAEEDLEVPNGRTRSSLTSELDGPRPLSWDQGGKDLNSSGSSSSSYKSLENSQEEFLLRTPPTIKKKGLFIHGDSPTKLDNDVLLALAEVEIDIQKYPSLHKWKNTVLSYTTSDMQSWPSPAVLKRRCTPQPINTGSSCRSGLFSPSRYSPGMYMSSPVTGADLGASPGLYSPAHASHIQLLRLKHFSEPVPSYQMI